jgi:DNA topoisomerase VI subunit B
MTQQQQTFERTTFTINRALEFFSEKELTMQIGHPRHMWPIALVKELIDNALDACEGGTTGAPEITVIVESDAVTVSDNGPGLPLATLRKSLNYAVRVSDKAYYVSPTRGQLGNALKCVWAAPFVVSGGEHGQVIVASRGKQRTIDVRLDRLAGQPNITLQNEPCDVKKGTIITMRWPGIAGYLFGDKIPSFYKAPTVWDLATRYAAFNPDLTITVIDKVGGQQGAWERSTTTATRWAPSWPTSPHWYTDDRFRTLIAGELAAARENGSAPTVRGFVANFAGLAGTAPQKAVTDATGLTGAPLTALINGNEVDQQCATALLHAMQSQSRAIKPAKLGAVGKEHLVHHLVNEYFTEPESILYRKFEGTTDGVPYILEMAFGVYDKESQERPAMIAMGANWSPVLTPSQITPLQRALTKARVDPADPVALIVHLTCPRIETTDHGKGAIVL